VGVPGLGTPINAAAIVAGAGLGCGRRLVAALR
jgi:hypothetical protein